MTSSLLFPLSPLHIVFPVRCCILIHGTLAQQAINAPCNRHKPNSFVESSTKLCCPPEDKTRLHPIGADCSTDARKGLKFAKRLSTKWPGKLVISHGLQKRFPFSQINTICKIVRSAPCVRIPPSSSCGFRFLIFASNVVCHVQFC